MRGASTDRWRWELLFAALTLTVAWLSSRSIADATDALERRVASRQREIDGLAAAQRAFRARQRAAHTAPHALVQNPVHSLFPGQRMVIDEVDGASWLVLQPAAPPAPGN